MADYIFPRPAGDVLLVDIKDDVDPPVAVFTDGSELEFPSGSKFVPDNLELDNGEVMQRLRFEPERDGATGKYVQPHFWIPRYCTKEYVLSCIRRIVHKV